MLYRLARSPLTQRDWKVKDRFGLVRSANSAQAQSLLLCPALSYSALSWEAPRKSWGHRNLCPPLLKCFRRHCLWRAPKMNVTFHILFVPQKKNCLTRHTFPKASCSTLWNVRQLRRRRNGSDNTSNLDEVSTCCDVGQRNEHCLCNSNIQSLEGAQSTWENTTDDMKR